MSENSLDHESGWSCDIWKNMEKVNYNYRNRHKKQNRVMVKYPSAIIFFFLNGLL